jgi:fibronectin type 3 domain-containing protein
MNVTNNRHLLSLLLFFFAVWQALSVTGCGGLGNVPSASTAESGKVTLSWNADPEATGYAVYMSTSPGVTPLNGYRFPVKENSITITALSPGMTYYFIVTALGQSGEVGRSKEMSYTAASDEVGLIDFKVIRTEAAPEPAAVQPSRQEAEKPVTLAWENVPGATSYNLYWRNQAGVTKQNGKKISNVKNPHKITGWKKGMTYYFVITAVNKNGESQESAEMSYTVP